MKVECVWEHNGNDTLLYAVNLPGAYARGGNRDIAVQKMPAEVRSWLRWSGRSLPRKIVVEIVQETPCDLQICDADSDVLFDAEKLPLTIEEYTDLKELVLKSAADFQRLYDAIPDKTKSDVPVRKTFYGFVPRTADEMYVHTKNVNAYYFGEIGVEADNEGSILDCRRRGFEVLEKSENYLSNQTFDGSWGESWTLRKMLRRFLWHDRIHARAMYRLAERCFGPGSVSDVFCFSSTD